MRAQSAPILHELFWTVYLLSMQFHLSLITPQGSLHFRGTFPLIYPQKPCMTTSCSGDRIGVLLQSSCPLSMKPSCENLKVPRRLCQRQDIALKRQSQEGEDAGLHPRFLLSTPCESVLLPSQRARCMMPCGKGRYDIQHGEEVPICI
jgi:hypothetical protein